MKYINLFLIVCVLGIVGCEKDGAEGLGEKIDESARDAGNAIEDTCEDVKEGVGADDTDC